MSDWGGQQVIDKQEHPRTMYRFLMHTIVMLLLLPGLIESFLPMGVLRRLGQTTTHHDRRRCQSAWGLVSSRGGIASSSSTSSSCGAVGERFEIAIDLPSSLNSPVDADVITATLRFDSILSAPAEVIVVRYRVPCALNLEPQRGFAVCTADGPGGERVGDILRYTSVWSLGLPRGVSVLSTVGAFGGALSWQCGLFDVMKAKSWQQVAEALTSNTVDRTDELVLVFERSKDGIGMEQSN